MEEWGCLPYLKLRSSFIGQVLHEIGLPIPMVKLIMHCVCLNGELSDTRRTCVPQRNFESVLVHYLFGVGKEEWSRLLTRNETGREALGVYSTETFKKKWFRFSEGSPDERSA